MEVLVQKKLKNDGWSCLLQAHWKLSCKTFFGPFLLEIGCSTFSQRDVKDSLFCYVTIIM